MLSRRLLYLLTLTILAASIPCLAVDGSLTYTGDLFGPYSQTYFCGQASDNGGGVPGVPIAFQGTTVWNRIVTSGTLLTNSVGRACANTYWQPDVYEMKVIGKGGPFTGVTSPPAAVTIFNKDWAGVYAGGAIDMNFYGAPPNFNFWNPDVRTATFGFFSKTVEQKYPTVSGPGHPMLTYVGKPSWLLFLDPFNPLGAVKITAQNFTTELLIGPAQPQDGITSVIVGTSVNFYGYCWFQQGNAAPVWAYMEGELDVHPFFVAGATDGGVIQSDHPYFSIYVTKYPATDLYGAWGTAHDGGAYLKCTGGHKPPP